MKLIDADALKKHVTEHFESVYGGYDLQDMVTHLDKSINYTGLKIYMETHLAVSYLKSYLDSAPEVDMVPHGHWIDLSDRYVTCSECGLVRDHVDGTTFDFCPHCGARMDGGQHATD